MGGGPRVERATLVLLRVGVRVGAGGWGPDLGAGGSNFVTRSRCLNSVWGKTGATPRSQNVKNFGRVWGWGGAGGRAGGGLVIPPDPPVV